MIRMRLWALDTIHHTIFNITTKYTSLHAPKYVLKYTPDCIRLNTPSLLDLRSQVSSQDAPKYTSEYDPKYTSEYVLKYTPGYALKDAPSCTRWHTHSLLDCTLPSNLSRCSQAYSRARSPIHSQLHSMTLPACFTIRSQVSSQDAPKYTLSTLPSTPPSTFSSTLPSMLSRTLLIALDGTLLACLTVRSQVSSRDGLKYTPNCTR